MSENCDDTSSMSRVDDIEDGGVLFEWKWVVLFDKDVRKSPNFDLVFSLGYEVIVFVGMNVADS